MQDRHLNIAVSLSEDSFLVLEQLGELFSLIDKALLYKEEFPDMNTIKFIYYLNIYGENSLIIQGLLLMLEENLFHLMVIKLM